MKKNKKKIFIIAGAVILCGLIGGGVYFSKNYYIAWPGSSKSKTVSKTETKTENKSADAIKVIIGSADGSEGNTITIPVKIDNISKKGIDGCDFKLKYDPKVLEVTGAQAADLLSDNKDNFSSSVDSANGIISVLFMDSTTGKQAITKNGTFMNITLKVKSGAAKGKSKISLSELGAFADTDLNEEEASFNEGNISIK